MILKLIVSNAPAFVRQCPRIRQISSYFVVVGLIKRNSSKYIFKPSY